VIFLTLFLDLVAFSIIFPLFPAMLEHYQGDRAFEAVVGTLGALLGVGEGDDPRRVQALFGGFLGSLYSLLQFLASPLWGRLSDRIGRRPVLSITVLGIAASHLLWALSGSFALLLLSRIIAGAMGGNISTATAAVSDVTSRSDRARGMGMVGAAFGLGFVLGPAIGVALSPFDLAATFPGLVRYGVNPFSACAFGAGLLSLINWVWIRRRFAETLPPERRGGGPPRPLLPRPGLGGRSGPAVARTNFANFFLITAFSGMEFTLAFLARDRFGWSPRGIGLMFVHVGLVLALVQGGVVRRLAPRIGERRLALSGFALVALGLVGIAAGESAALFWVSLSVLATGSGFCFPALAALVSLHAAETVQGEALGVFRALGSLARAIGPLAAALLYWRFGAEVPYLGAAAFLLLPFLLILAVPVPARGEMGATDGPAEVGGAGGSDRGGGESGRSLSKSDEDPG